MNLKLVIVTIIIILIIVLAVWYFYSNLSQQPSPSYNTQTNQNVQPAINATGDKTVNILNDLKRIPDDASLNNEINSLNSSLQNF